MLTYTIPKFVECRNNGGYTLQQKKTQKSLESKPYKKFFLKTPIYQKADLNKFPDWLVSYVSEVENRKITDLKIFKITSTYENGNYAVKDKQLILSYKN
ncbi:hypothetical protein [Pedobacter arcticus]|uniref:hypothetical protein n=1 Tax=Pedobacter arcticus TaxID=752140 RepID=UPI0012B55C95|nr:hypothetical protein [Pedobacter arcticus]